MALSVLGIGASVVGAGGIYLLNRQNLSDLPFDTLKKFKDNKGGICSKQFIGDVNFEETVNGTITINSSYFSDSDTPKSCLVVNWKRTDSSDTNNDKWKGYFRWLWTFVKGKKGFVMFVTTKSSSAASTLDLEGGIYFVEDKDGIWTVKKKKELTDSDSKKFDSSSIDGLPIPSEEIKKTFVESLDEDKKTNWGFIKDKGDFSKLCKDLENGGDCPTTWKKPNEYKWAWVWDSSDKDPKNSVKDWSSNFPAWTKHLFGDSDESLKDASLDTPKGTWKS